MRNRFAILVAVAVAAFIVTPAVPASANTTCNADHFCVWTGTNYTGTKYEYQYGFSGISSAGIDFWQGGNGFQPRSVKNRLYDDVQVWFFYGAYTVPNGRIASGADEPDLKDFSNYAQRARLQFPNLSVTYDGATVTSGVYIADYTVTNTGGNYQVPGFYLQAQVEDHWNNATYVDSSLVALEPWGGNCNDGQRTNIATSTWTESALDDCTGFSSRPLDPWESMTVQLRRTVNTSTLPCSGTFTATTSSRIQIQTAERMHTYWGQPATTLQSINTSITC